MGSISLLTLKCPDIYFLFSILYFKFWNFDHFLIEEMGLFYRLTTSNLKSEIYKNHKLSNSDLNEISYI